MTFGTATVGEILADRYRLEEHIDTDAAGRQVWRGIDIVLRRPVALVLRHPGGEAAGEMLTAAVAASRLVHPHIISVYDAIDEGHRAYVVREWISGHSLREVVSDMPLDAERATLVTHAVAEAVSALHSAGIAHGNIHPGSVLIADDGRVVLADARADGTASPEHDVRSVGGILYAALTSHWPHAELGPGSLPDAVRDGNGRLATPRQVRGGIPRYLDTIAGELLDRRVAAPAAPALAAELARLAMQGADAFDEDAGPMGFRDSHGDSRRRAGGKLTFGIAILSLIAVIGAFLGVRALSSDSGEPQPSASTTPQTQQTTPATGGGAIAIGPTQVRIVDPPSTNRSEVHDAALTVDGNESTGWSTEQYKRPNFGGLKPGMGILIDLGTPTQVGSVTVVVSTSGATLSLRGGNEDPGATTDGDKQINQTYTPIGQTLADHPGTRFVFPVQQDTPVRYLLVWITKLPPATTAGLYQLTVNEITIQAP
jgi:hypothetical protein